VLESKKYPLLLNPKARSQRTQEVNRFITDHASQLTIHTTNSIDEAKKLAENFAADGEKIVIAAGGDGTLNAVVQGLSGSSTALGIIPSGTMNVFARELKIPLRKLKKAFDVIKSGKVSEVDLFLVNGSPFMQMAGLGFDAMVIEQTSWKSKKLLGPFAYVFSVMRLWGNTQPMMKVEYEDGRVEEGVAVIVGNGAFYGGSVKLFRKASNQDNMLDVLIFKKLGYRFLIDAIRGFIKGGIDMSDSVNYVQVSAFIVRCEYDFPVQVDGEFLGRATEAKFESSRRKLRVIIPVPS
jgi:diacylglycerol kinase (ATP)